MKMKTRCPKCHKFVWKRLDDGELLDLKDEGGWKQYEYHHCEEVS